MDIKELREQIDNIDAQIVELFRARMGVSLGVAEYKRERNMAVYDPARERALFARIGEMAGEEISGYAHSLYKTITELSRTYQHHILDPDPEIKKEIERRLEHSPKMLPKFARVACQGVEGAYSQIAAVRMFDCPKISYYGAFSDIFRAVESGECDYGVLPIENSTAGSVKGVYDLLKGSTACIIKSVRIKIDHNLLAKPGTKKEDIREIFSHEQAISQCAGYLRELEGVKVTVAANTAMAAKAVAESDRTDVAALSSYSCAELYGLHPIETSVQDMQNNYTRFILISREPYILPGAERTSIILKTPHTPGALYNTLARINSHGVNLIKLESRPIPERDFEFMFYFDIEASIYSPDLCELLAELSANSEDFKYLGSYSELV